MASGCNPAGAGKGTGKEKAAAKDESEDTESSLTFASSRARELFLSTDKDRLVILAANSLPLGRFSIFACSNSLISLAVRRARVSLALSAMASCKAISVSAEKFLFRKAFFHQYEKSLIPIASAQRSK